MGIELRENEWAEKMIRERSLGAKPRVTARRVARYYLDKGVSPKETESKIDNFIASCDSSYGSARRSEIAEYAVKEAQKHEAIDIKSIGVSQTELDVIAGLERKPLQRLAFTLLCLAKYHIIKNPGCDYWVTTPHNEIMSMANIKTSIKRQDAMYSELHQLGLIQFSKKIDSLNVRVCFVDDNPPVLQVPDMKNVGYRYMMYIGEPYFECENCGTVTKYTDPANKRRQKYCSCCAQNIKTQQQVEAVAKYRKKKS